MISKALFFAHVNLYCALVWQDFCSFFVTAQVFRSGSSQSEGLDQGVRVLSKGLQDIPALLFGGRDHGTVDDESIGPVFRPKAARDLLLDLHHASVLLRLVVGEGNVWIGQEA